jgi:hypothetical protein
MTRATPFLVGLLFGLCLCLSGMTDPPKVLGFLDLAGAWDPSLALVMGGAVVVSFFAFLVAALSRCRGGSAKFRRLSICQAAATAVRHVASASARSTR